MRIRSYFCALACVCVLGLSVGCEEKPTVVTTDEDEIAQYEAMLAEGGGEEVEEAEQ